LPSLVGREHLVEGNSKLETTNSIARIVGPGLAGQMIQHLTAPVAIIVDAISFLLSALSLKMIDSDEVIPAQPRENQNVWREIREGLALVFGNRLLWALAGCTATFNLFSNMWGAVFILYITDDLGLSPGLIGVIAMAGAPGALFGALLARRIATRLGLGRTIMSAIIVTGLGTLLIPLASGTTPVIAVMLIAAWFISGFGNVVYNVNQVSLRQAITPNRLLGRLNATMRFLVWGTIPLGALIGGTLGGAIGLHPTILVATIGSLFAGLWVFFSPVRTLREQPQPIEEVPVPSA
jgi:Na+/melibiose symporter-like transporter